MALSILELIAAVITGTSNPVMRKPPFCSNVRRFLESGTRELINNRSCLPCRFNSRAWRGLTDSQCILRLRNVVPKSLINTLLAPLIIALRLTGLSFDNRIITRLNCGLSSNPRDFLLFCFLFRFFTRDLVCFRCPRNAILQLATL